ncbi:MAG: ABC transporter substrate-binding protein [Oscillospiraceae bacterium]|nr:ABC transporter substrate-binding protein [Oscillospiraceae bacterium]
MICTKRKKPLALILAFLLICTVFSGCSNKAATTSASPSEGMETAGAQGAVRTITDMAGRTVQIPTNVTKVMGAANPDGMILYTIDPSLMVGWTAQPSKEAAAYLDAKAAALPKITSVSIWESPNKEEILKINPDFILAVVDIKNVDLSMYDKISKETGVPIVIADATLTNFDKTYEFLGDILNRKEQCGQLASYTKKLMQDISDTMKKIPDSDRISVYYASGKDGLSTSGDDNWNGEFVGLAGGKNVCDVQKKNGFAQISMEQVLKWNPSVIVQDLGGNASTVFSGNAWADIGAVKNHKIYSVPALPFNWVDKPTGVNRLIGIKWVNSILYPHVATYNMKSDLIEFYKLFYHYSLTEQEAASFLNTQLNY